jgi:hypothetical protein
MCGQQGGDICDLVRMCHITSTGLMARDHLQYAFAPWKEQLNFNDEVIILTIQLLCPIIVITIFIIIFIIANSN